MTHWADTAIWWQVYPLGFTGAERAALPPGTPPVPRLARIEPWLDYLVELGCNGLLLGPVFASETHGYDTVDHFAVDARLGTTDDLVSLFRACHERGVRVLLDGVFNHVGRGFGPFQDVLEHGAESPYASWFHLDRSPEAEASEDGFGYATFEGHTHLVALNHDEPAVADYVASVMVRWLDAGADGWRLDAAYAVPTAFWREVSDRVRANRPDAWLLGEVIHGDYAAFVTEGGLDSVTQYELWKAIWSSVNDGNLFELAWALSRHDEFASTFRPQTFVGNHDVTRIASRLTDDRHLGHALAVLFTVAGVPSVYAGDEQGFRGVKEDREGGDDEIRPAFPDLPSDLSQLGRPVLAVHQELIALRRRHPWLVDARTTAVEKGNAWLGYVSEARGGRLVVLLNLDDQPHRFAEAERAVREQAVVAGASGTGWRTGAGLLAGPGEGAGAAAAGAWVVPAHSWAVLVEGE